MDEYGNNENKLYLISSACAAVRIVSDYFGTEKQDPLTIDPQGANIIFHGDLHDAIDVVIEKSEFQITFTSDGSYTNRGYKLRWFCNG